MKQTVTINAPATFESLPGGSKRYAFQVDLIDSSMRVANGPNSKPEMNAVNTIIVEISDKLEALWKSKLRSQIRQDQDFEPALVAILLDYCKTYIQHRLANGGSLGEAEVVKLIAGDNEHDALTEHDLSRRSVTFEV